MKTHGFFIAIMECERIPLLCELHAFFVVFGKHKQSVYLEITFWKCISKCRIPNLPWHRRIVRTRIACLRAPVAGYKATGLYFQHFRCLRFGGLFSSTRRKQALLKISSPSARFLRAGVSIAGANLAWKYIRHGGKGERNVPACALNLLAPLAWCPSRISFLGTRLTHKTAPKRNGPCKSIDPALV